VGLTLDNKRQRKKPKKIKKQLTRIEPYYSNYSGNWVNTDSGAQTATTTTMTIPISDGYDYVDIRTLIYKLNEIIDYIKGEK